MFWCSEGRIRRAVPLLLAAIVVVDVADGHGSMIDPPPRQPEAEYWYQVGCLIGCKCSGSGKETYPTPESLDCPNPSEPTTPVDFLSWNVEGQSVREDWNRYMPWRSPGSSIPLDSCGIASGFLPTAAVQYAHYFTDHPDIKQGQRGTELPEGPISTWKKGSIVEASFRLGVNHGGGYQYRVCNKKKGQELTEECFAQNPLLFATDTHTIVTPQKDDEKETRIVIPATDHRTTTTTGEPSIWRRIPIPACNCDMGTDCKLDASTADDYVPYNTGSNVEGYKSCTFGLQFEAPHLQDGTWPDGYGYFVATLGDERNNGKHPCTEYTDETTCHNHSSSSSEQKKAYKCLWYVEKNLCYETYSSNNNNNNDGNNDKEEEQQEFSCSKHSDKMSCIKADASSKGNKCLWYDLNGKTICYEQAKTEVSSNKDKNRALEEENFSCSKHSDEASCIEADASSKGNKCTWYASKSVCYAAAAVEKEIETTKTEASSDKNTAAAADDVNWYILDQLYAPTEIGDYILQWRWDNEQTPQIWTTCADISVVENDDDSSGASSSYYPIIMNFFLLLVVVFSM